MARLFKFLFLISLAYAAISIRNRFVFFLLAFFISVEVVVFFAKKNPQAKWVKFLFTPFGARTDVKFMTKTELYQSGAQYLFYSVFVLILLIGLAYVGPHRIYEWRIWLLGVFFSLFFGLFLFFAAFFFGGLYMLVRGLFRNKDYILPKNVEISEPETGWPIYDRLKSELDSHNIKWTFENGMLTVETDNSNGFDVTFYGLDEAKEYTVCGGDLWHFHFEDGKEAFGCFMSCLTTHCRLKVIRRGDFTSWAAMERNFNGKWEMSNWIGLFVFPFWRKKTVQYLQNDLIQYPKTDWKLPQE